MIWFEEDIREEIRKLDKKTGLNGASFPIKFNKSNSILAYYRSIDAKSGEFCFSVNYFQNENYTKKEAIETIRHEYAHYMNHVIYRSFGHGPTWRKCCSDIGAVAQRVYNRRLNNYFLLEREKEQEMLERCDSLVAGVKINHPIYGTGVVESTQGDLKDKCLSVSFAMTGIKILTAKWVLENCEVIE